MFGNCATGRVAMVTAPTITVRIAITIATIGRLMKNLDISVALHERLGVDFHAGTSFLYPLGHHTFSRLQPFGHDPHRANPFAHLYCPDADRIRTVHNSHLIAALQFRHRALWNE